MGQRAGAAFDVGLQIGIAEVEISRYVGGAKGRYLDIAKKAMSYANAPAQVLVSNNININKGQMGQIQNLFNTHNGQNRSSRDPLLVALRQLRVDYSETIHGYDHVNGTLYGTAFDLGSAMGMGEAQASFWGIGPNEDINKSAQLAIDALERAKPFAAALKNIYSGVDPSGMVYVRNGYGDPDHTGNGFKVAYERFIQERELLHNSLYNTGP